VVDFPRQRQIAAERCQVIEHALIGIASAFDSLDRSPPRRPAWPHGVASTRAEAN
jgi:hypothetical protein